MAVGAAVVGGAGVDSARLNELEGLLDARSKELVEMSDKVAILEKKVTQVGKEKEMIEKKMQRIEKAKEQEVAELKDKLEASQGDVRIQLKVSKGGRRGEGILSCRYPSPCFSYGLLISLRTLMLS